MTHKCNEKTIEKLHGGDAWNHTLRVVDSLPADNPMLRLAALFHDVGKGETQCPGEDGEMHFYRHEEIGAEMVVSIAARFRMSNEQTEYLVNLVANHMFPMGERLTKPAVKRFMRRCPWYKDVAMLRVADKQGNLVFSKRNEVYQGVELFNKFVAEIEAEDAVMKVTDLAINGHDLIEIGFKPGPYFKRLLEEMLEKVTDEELANDAEELREYARGQYA